MKKTFLKIRWFFVMACAAIASFVSKAMWQAIDNDRGAQQWFYWVYRSRPIPVSVALEPSSTSSIIDTVVKCFEFVLFAAIFVVWIVSFLKIRKIEDKELKSNKIKRSIIAIVVLLVIWILVWLWYRLYNEYAW